MVNHLSIMQYRYATFHISSGFSNPFCTLQKNININLASMPQACNFIKKEALAKVFYCEFCEIFIEHVRWLLLQHEASIENQITELIKSTIAKVKGKWSNF